MLQIITVLISIWLFKVIRSISSEPDLFAHWTSRNLLQSDRELQMLCNVSSDIAGAQVVFNENLLTRLCSASLMTMQDGECKDIPPIWQELQTELPCSVVVAEGLCEDNFVTRANYCAKSCNRCMKQTCSKTLAGCQCSSPWTFRETGASYPGCANPDGDQMGPWCEIDRSTCEREPATKTYDYCASDCLDAESKKEEVAVISLQTDDVPFPNVPQPPTCLTHQQKCTKSCGGQHKIKQSYCDIEGEKCECIVAESCEEVEQTCEDKCQQIGEQVREFSCTPNNQQLTICSCGMAAVPAPTTTPRELPASPQLLSPSPPSTVVPAPTSNPTPQSGIQLIQDTLIVGKCFNYLPAQEATCSERLQWGSCEESWMQEKYYCAATCGYCAVGEVDQCFNGFQNCASECGGDMMIQFFACYKNFGGSTDCKCRDEAREYLPAIPNISNKVCEDVTPPGGSTCEERVNWGSCKEYWFRQANYCAKSCAYCTLSNDPAKINDKQTKGGNFERFDVNTDMVFSSSSETFIDSAGIAAARSIKYDDVDEAAVFQSLGMIPIFTNKSFYNTSTVDDNAQAILDNILEDISGLLPTDFLKSHNDIRKQYCVQDLKWSKDLVSESELWASKCVMELDTSTPHGQNMLMDASSKTISAASAVQNWILNVQQYDFKRPIVGMKFSTLTQLLWSDTTEVGCAAAQCPRGQMVVCRYNPTGNVPGSTNKNIFHPSTCS